jgi:hypothetical protein
MHSCREEIEVEAKRMSGALYSEEHDSELIIMASDEHGERR